MRKPLTVAAFVSLLSIAAGRADTIELLSGAKLEGRVVTIDKEAKEVTFEAEVSGRKTLTAAFTR
jgi:hypothetical protein